jgi:hypothetical protein
LLDTRDQRVDLSRRRVEIGRRARRRGDAETLMDRPPAVVTGANRDTDGVKHLRDVVRVHLVEGEGDRAAALDRFGRPENPDAVERAQPG